MADESLKADPRAHNASGLAGIRTGQQLMRGLVSLRRKMFVLAQLPVALMILLAVSLLRPLLLVRFGVLNSVRIGHFVGNTDLYLCEREAGMHPRRVLDIFAHDAQVCNRQLMKMWARKMHIWSYIGRVHWLAVRLPWFKAHIVPMPSPRDVHGIRERTGVNLRFTPEEERLGSDALRELGIPDKGSFVSFHNRDSAYLDAARPKDTKQASNWRYHDYRDSCIGNYVPAAEELTRRGLFAVRLGAIVKDPLNTANPMVIDYVTNGRTEFLDIYLAAKCHFYLGASDGFSSIPLAFRRPIAIVNSIPFEDMPSWGRNVLFIPKKLRLKSEGRFLSFREILNSGIGRFQYSGQYEQRGIEAVENTAEEITALAIEMDERLKGTWETTPEDEELQSRFWSLVPPSDLNGVVLGRIGAEFLRKNRGLLD